MSQMVQGGRPIARFRVFGFPVTIDISFVIIVAILGWYPGVLPRDFVIWLVMVPFAVLVHELGHAFVARTTGARPAITLAGLGGLTSYLPPRPLSRARSVAISTAGPAVGIVIGLALLAIGRGVGVSNDLLRSVLNTAIFTTLGWSVLNLLPILPLDGGQTLRELLPGSPARREVRAAAVSVVVAVLGAVVAYRYGLVFAALLAVFFVFSNVMTVKNARDEQKVDVNQRLLVLLWGGRSDEARDLLADQPSDAAVHPLVRATVRAATDDPAGGLAELQAAAARGSEPPDAATLLLLAHRARGEWAEVAALLTGPFGGRIDPGAALTAQVAAHASGAVRESAEIGQAYLARVPAGAAGGHVGTLAFRTACAWAAVGEPDRGMAAFRRAADLGFDNLTSVDSDDDLAPLRPLPGYDEARQVIRARALAKVDETPHS